MYAFVLVQDGHYSCERESLAESLARRLRINFYAPIYRGNATFYFSAAQFLAAAH